MNIFDQVETDLKLMVLDKSLVILLGFYHIICIEKKNQFYFIVVQN